MRRLTLILAAALALTCAAGMADGLDLSRKPLTTGAGTAATGTVSDVRGYVEEVFIAVSDGVSTGAVTVVVDPAIGADWNLATNSVIGEKRFRPVVERTTVAGVDLTNDTPVRPLIDGEKIVVTVSGSPTNKTWYCIIKFNDQ